ncbi:ArnT family glycosyltransferase [Hydrogenovibrio kuenenii]|uniref:ArnT family glycosyltransferase n=1 Tax=Hydrogenovibrio kuenenii TaxID=63658 RepID=UPI000466A338|nr:glycosyltransferase family 39 protein [Hydrogenovibrio kuenenii]
MQNAFYRHNLHQNSAYGYALLLILAMTAWHLILAGRVNLSVDEAHYALYGLKLDWSYFDHPPMVGWLNAIATYFSHSDFGLRVIPITFFAASNFVLYHVACRLYPSFRWIGFWTLALVNSAFMFELLATSMLPDTPLMFASLMAVWHLLNLRDASEQRHSTLKYWLWLGFWIGIAGLSKYTSVILIASLVLIVLLERRWNWLWDKGLWFAIVLAGIMITPVLYWNATHDWISFLYQIHHGTYNQDWSWVRVLSTQLAQFALYTPTLYLLGAWLMLSAWVSHSPSNKLLAAFSLPTVILFAMNSGHEMSLPHWTQLAWLFIAPAVVFWVWQHWASKALRWFIYLSSSVSLIMVIILNSQLYTPWMPVKSKDNPVHELHGWQQAVNEAISLQNQHPNTALFAANWSQASRIGWYAYPQPVYVTDNRFDQFDLWFGNPKQGSNGIVIVPSYESQDLKLNQPGHFKTCQLAKTLPIQAHHDTIVTYRLFYCQDFEAPSYSGWALKLPIVQQVQTLQAQTQ